MQLADLAADHDIDVGLRLDPIDQILRHGLRSGRRAISVTCRARLARNTVACPAEFPPPTSATSWPAQIRLERDAQ